MVRVRVRLGYTMAICLVLATPSKPQNPSARGGGVKVMSHMTLINMAVLAYYTGIIKTMPT